jgi:hypothetical protein
MVLRNAVHPVQWMILDDDDDDDDDEDDMLSKQQQGGWNSKSECKTDQGTDCEDGDSDTDWKMLTEYNMCFVICFVMCLKLIVKYLFLAHILFLRGRLRLG